MASSIRSIIRVLTVVLCVSLIIPSTQSFSSSSSSSAGRHQQPGTTSRAIAGNRQQCHRFDFALHAETPATSSRRSFMQGVAGSAIVTSMATSQGLVFSTASSIANAASGGAAAAAAEPPSIDLPPMGLGAWAWGDSVFWGYEKKNDDELRQVFDYAVANTKGPVLLDSAELYGFGRSERLIGEFSRRYPPEKILLATKFAPFPWCTKAQDVVTACEKSLQRLQRPIDLYQIHFPNAWSNAAYWDGLAMAYEKGLVKAVGVSNYGVDATRACHNALQKRGIPLATNQIQLSLLYRWPLENGLMQACNDLGVQVLSYSPLALGMLTGKYSPDKKPTGPRKKLFEQLVTTPDYENLLSTMEDIATGHAGASKAQVALNWARSKGSIPIPGARTVKQIASNNAALSWNLSKEEETVLDQAAGKVTTFIKPEANPFPRKDKDTGLIMYDS